jgi:hypothetical protein
MVSHSTLFAQKWVNLYLAAEFFSLRLPRSVTRYIIQLYRNQPECIGDIPQLLGDFPKLFSDIPEDAILVLVHCRHTNLCAKKPLLACKEYVTLLWTTWCNVRIDFCEVSSMKNCFDETKLLWFWLVGFHICWNFGFLVLSETEGVKLHLWILSTSICCHSPSRTDDPWEGETSLRWNVALFIYSALL